MLISGIYSEIKGGNNLLSIFRSYSFNKHSFFSIACLLFFKKLSGDPGGRIVPIFCESHFFTFSYFSSKFHKYIYLFFYFFIIFYYFLYFSLSLRTLKRCKEKGQFEFFEIVRFCDIFTYSILCTFKMFRNYPFKDCSYYTSWLFKCYIIQKSLHGSQNSQKLLPKSKQKTTHNLHNIFMTTEKI